MRHLAAWRDAPFHYPSDFICRKSAERLDSMANKPSDPGSESVCRLQRSISDIGYNPLKGIIAVVMRSVIIFHQLRQQKPQLKPLNAPLSKLGPSHQ